MKDMNSNYYLKFENKFRGDREKILKLFNSYEPLIDLLIQKNPSANLLDIGCGRGEWLQKCRNKFSECIGIESDRSMINVCRDNHLNVIEGDAIAKLAEFPAGSVSVITVFHVIEHLEHNQLIELINHFQRVLTDDGVLIMETPSIDNLIVSTKLFHIDHTHINPINPEAISFHLEECGFKNVKHLYINGGPLQEASHLKITRILNGVAQDLCIIATKTTRTFDIIFNKNSTWYSNLNIGITTLEAAIDHDLKLESLVNNFQRSMLENKKIIDQNNSEINNLKEEIVILRSRLKYLNYLLKIIKILIKPIFILLRYIRKIFLILCNKVFMTLVAYKLTRQFLVSDISLKIINFLLRYLFANSAGINVNQVQNKINKIIERDSKFFKHNKNLLVYHQQSKESKDLFSKYFK